MKNKTEQRLENIEMILECLQNITSEILKILIDESKQKGKKNDSYSIELQNTFKGET